ncbi:MAG: hypothetical protein ACOH19_10005 [Rhodoglobus sp.]
MKPITTTSPAVEWAARVSDRRYPRSRHELDQLIVNTVPAYAAAVDEELDRFERAAVEARVAIDARHQALWSISQTGDRLSTILTWLVLSFIAISFALAFPGGGRTGVSVPIEWMPTTTAVSSTLFTIAVVAQIARWTPYIRHIPPKDALAWVTVIFGIPMMVWMFWLQQQNIGVPLGPVVLAIIALLVSVCASVARLIRRMRDPRLTKEVDAAAKDRTKVLRKQILALANLSANRLAERFSSLPHEDQERLMNELDLAVAQLENRSLITPRGARTARHGASARAPREMFPGLLLLSHRVKAVNALTNGAAEWFVGDYVEDAMMGRFQR